MEEWKYIKACDYCYNVTDGTHDSPKQKETGKYLLRQNILKVIVLILIMRIKFQKMIIKK